VTVHVTDLERSRDFYSKVLGLEEDASVPNVPRGVFKIPGGSTRLIMRIQREGEGGREPGTVSGILFCCADPVAACAEIQKRGGSVVDEPWTMQRDSATIVRAVIADPDGDQFLLSSAP
jgi:predicted enzyme related to lactoylglutathione lyase